MDNINYILFFCIFPPLLLSLGLIDKRSRVYVVFITIGFYICFAISGLNGWILKMYDNDVRFVTTTYTPITEEVCKAIPLLIYAFAFDHEREKLVSLAFLTGIGFAMMENLIILIDEYPDVDMFWAIIRGFASASLHGVCTSMVGFGMSFVRQKKKLFITGTFSLLVAAITVHGIYNSLVSSEYDWIGYILPLAVYALFDVNKVYNIGKKKKEVEYEK